MQETLILAGSIGFAHAFEADHLVAVSSIVTKRNNTLLAIKDGAFWGLGHTLIILVVCVVYMVGRFVLNEDDFKYFEALVGLMLIVLGISRLYKFFNNTDKHHEHNADGSHKFAFGVGAIHGLAGSGAVLISLLSQTKQSLDGIVYILVFGLGSIVGMMIASGIFSVPFSSKLLQNKYLSNVLTVLSCCLCMVLGIMIIYKNLV